MRGECAGGLLLSLLEIRRSQAGWLLCVSGWAGSNPLVSTKNDADGSFLTEWRPSQWTLLFWLMGRFLWEVSILRRFLPCIKSLGREGLGLSQLSCWLTLGRLLLFGSFLRFCDVSITERGPVPGVRVWENWFNWAATSLALDGFFSFLCSSFSSV